MAAVAPLRELPPVTTLSLVRDDVAEQLAGAEALVEANRHDEAVARLEVSGSSSAPTRRSLTPRRAGSTTPNGRSLHSAPRAIAPQPSSRALALAAFAGRLKGVHTDGLSRGA
jgi:hypothetical protein